MYTVLEILDPRNYPSIWITPIVLQLNYLLMQTLFQQYSSTYSSLPAHKKTEAIARLNSMLVGASTSIAWFYIYAPEDIVLIGRLFIGYLIYDMAYVTTSSMAIHHIVTAVICYYTKYISSPNVLRNMLSIMGALESSAITISLCWLMNTAKYPQNRVNTVVKAGSFLYWTTMRLGVFPYLLYICDSYAVKIAFSPILFLNIYWFKVILEYIFRPTTI